MFHVNIKYKIMQVQVKSFVLHYTAARWLADYIIKCTND